MYKVAPKLKLGYELTATYADEEYLDSYFTVDENASVGRAAYEAEDAGFMNYSAELKSQYMLNKQTFIAANIGFDMLTGDAEDSSIVEEDFLPKASIAYVYRF